MKIAVIGTGYVGLVAGVCFAEAGNDVIGVDVNLDKLRRLNAGELPIYEPGLEHIFHRNTREERLLFTDDLARAVAQSEVIFLALPTPPGADGSADLKYVLGASRDIGNLLGADTEYKIVVTKSTVPVGTADKVRAAIAENAKSEFDVISNPEFLREGVAIEDFMKPERVVIGIGAGSPDPARAETVMRELYRPFLMSGNPLLVMDARSAEVTKYAANSMLALRISFMNDIANLCEKCDADVDKVRLGIGLDSRIGKRFLFAGTGYGGSCFGGDETIWLRENGALVARSMEENWENRAGLVHDKGCDWKPGNAEILAFDCETKKPVYADVQAWTKRFYRGQIVTITTSMNRRLRVTADHPVIVREDGLLAMRLAATIQISDEVLALSEMPEGQIAPNLDLNELLRDMELANSIHVSAPDEHFAAQYPQFRASASEFLKCPEEIKKGDRMPFKLWHHLRQSGNLQSSASQTQLYTAKGGATKINGEIAQDADFFRFIGYYLSEGHISVEKGRVNRHGEHALRERIGICFGEHEPYYVADARRILGNWGVKWMESRGPGAVATVVSSRIFAWLLRDYLGCGTRSEDKALPRGAFEAPLELRLELLRGLFSGDGSLTPLHDGRNAMLEYATVSRALADGICLLLQSVGIVASMRARRMNKSTCDAYIIRVSGREQMQKLSEVFGDRNRVQLAAILDGYERTIAQRGLERDGSCAVLKVREVTSETVEMPVYSAETSAGTLVVGSGLIAHNCFPKDVQALVATGQEFGAPQTILEAAEAVNQRQKMTLIPRIEAHFDGDLTGKTFAVWGLAFKPNTDDIREAPALVIVDELIARGARVQAYDPEAMNAVQSSHGDRWGENFEFSKRHYDACDGADAIVIVTEWPKFREPDFDYLKELLNEPTIFDGRNVYELETMRREGFNYYSIGRPVVKA